VSVMAMERTVMRAALYREGEALRLGPRFGALGRDAYQLSRSDLAEREENSRNHRPNVLHTIPNAENDYSNTDRLKILLKLDPLVGGDEDLEASVDRRPKKNSVPETQPPLVPNGCDVVAPQLDRELSGQRLVNENAQRHSPLRWRFPGPQLLVHE
jgi:hypothetical protein